MSVKLNLGSGGRQFGDYVNIDINPGKGVDKVMDITTLSYPDKSVDLIYSRHVIEHFGRNEIYNVIKEWVRVLKPNGKIVLDFPDLQKYTEYYIEHQSEIDIDEFARWLYGNQDHPYNYHKNGLSTSTIQKMFNDFNVDIIKIQSTEVRLNKKLRTKYGPIKIGTEITGIKGD